MPGFPPWHPTLVPAVGVVGSWPSGIPAASSSRGSRDAIRMRALVVYESMFADTRLAASNIADGLRADYEVTVVPVAEATPELVAAADLLLAGAPLTCTGCPARRPGNGRRGRRPRAAASCGLTRMPAARDAGLAAGHRHRGGLAAAFDARVNGVGVLTGRASRRIAKLLKRHGYRLVAGPQSFLVCSHNMLLDGEASWARRCGHDVGESARPMSRARPRTPGGKSGGSTCQDRGGRPGLLLQRAAADDLRVSAVDGTPRGAPSAPSAGPGPGTGAR